MKCLLTFLKAFKISLSLLLLSSQAVYAEDLLTIYQAIQKNDPAWQASKLAYEAGVQSKGIGRAHLLPSVALGGEYAEVTDNNDCDNSSGGCIKEDEYDSTTYQVELVQPLFNKEKWHIYREAKANFELAEIEYQGAQQQNIYDSAVLYFEVLRAQEDYNLALAEQTALGTQLKEIKAKADAGVADQTDVIETQASYDLATVNQITLIGMLKVAYEDLITRTDIAKPTVMRLSPEFPVKLLVPFDENLWLQKAETNSPNLRSLKQNITIAKQNFRKNTSAIYPSIDLFAKLTHQEQEGGQFVQNGERESVGVRARWPIFAGFGDYYTSKQQKKLMLQTEQDSDAQTREFKQIIKNRFRSIYTDVLTVEAQKKSVSSSERALRAVKAQYDLGSRDMIDLLNAQKQVFESKKEYAHARYNYVLDLMQLKLFVGELSLKDLEELNDWLVPDPSLLNLDQLP
jgi:outer membrane protein